MCSVADFSPPKTSKNQQAVGTYMFARCIVLTPQPLGPYRGRRPARAIRAILHDLTRTKRQVGQKFKWELRGKPESRGANERPPTNLLALRAEEVRLVTLCLTQAYCCPRGSGRPGKHGPRQPRLPGPGLRTGIARTAAPKRTKKTAGRPAAGSAGTATG